MEKQDLINLLNEIFVPLGFKKKGNNWVLNKEEIAKILNLQKSQFSNSFYINYDYIVKAIPLDGFRAHIFNGLSSSNEVENAYIKQLLDLESSVNPEKRLSDLRDRIQSKIVSEFNEVNNEADLLKVLNRRERLIGIPPLVLEHFNLAAR
ncbi:DUF4304 domain-containing protein [Pedobacter sp. ISL-68]|uniref:DUF4304 domain-containing protein n=1 Tax=unclassified Pedobacter TaxID=2628915 RepID=UPI001BEC4A8D|nr:MULTISPECIES: DUF4304 domain-containing protein [unclassified Pedobacter]MBT2561347.1 DUF4304 domain-containing protein [Pedobacter sp. ISL-64]MBT2590736.1 DUF4304 domain-containing protein [Pedobacter sp. ISL-68]